MTQVIDDAFPRNDLGDTSSEFQIPQDPEAALGNITDSLKTSPALPVAEKNTAPQRVNEELLNALRLPQDPSKLLDEHITTESIEDVNETINERLNRMSSPNFELDFGSDNLSREDFFPSIDRKILAGSSTNEFVGTQPIFVGEGALYPFAITQSRQKAQKIAAEKRGKLRKRVRKLGEMHTAVQYDDDFQDIIGEVYEEYGEKVNFNYEELADSKNPVGREFFQEVRKMKVMKNDLLAADKQARGVRKDLNDPTKFIPDSVLTAAEAIVQGQGDIRVMLGSKKERGKFYEGVSRIQSYANATEFLDERFSGTKIGAEVTSELKRGLDEILAGTNKELQGNIITKWASAEADQLIQLTKSLIDKGRVETLVRTAVKHSNLYKGEDLKTKAERDQVIQNYIDYTYNMLGQSLKTKVTYPTVRPDKDGGGGSDSDKDDTTLFGGALLGAKNKQNEIAAGVKEGKKLISSGNTQGASHRISKASTDNLGFTFQNVDLSEVSYGKSKSLEGGRIVTLAPSDNSNKIEVFVNGKKELMTALDYAKRIVNNPNRTSEEEQYFLQLTGQTIGKKDDDDNEIIIDPNTIKITAGNIFDSVGGFGNLVETGVVWGKQDGNDFIPVTNQEIADAGGTSTFQLLGYNKTEPMVEKFSNLGTAAEIINTTKSSSGIGAIYNFTPLKSQADVATMNSTLPKSNIQLNKDDNQETDQARKKRLLAEKKKEEKKKKGKTLPQ